MVMPRALSGARRQLHEIAAADPAGRDGAEATRRRRLVELKEVTERVRAGTISPEELRARRDRALAALAAALERRA